MNKSSITKVLNKVITQDTCHSLGFRRLTSLPVRVRSSFNLSVLLGGADVKDAQQKQKLFLSSLSDDEFINWLKVA